MAEGIPARLTPVDGRRFGIVVGAAFLVLGAVLLYRNRPLAAELCGAVGGALVLLGLVLPAVLLPVQRAWMAMARMISKITTPLILGLIYFGVITPIGIARRLLTPDPLRTRSLNGSRWVRRDLHHRPPKDMEHQF